MWRISDTQNGVLEHAFVFSFYLGNLTIYPQL